MKPTIDALDHLVLTVANIGRSVRFYTDILGMEIETFHPADGSTRTAIRAGAQKINLHTAGQEFEPKADHPTPGSGDLCFLSDSSVEDWMVHLKQNTVEIIDGPVRRTGALGPILSIYVRDPDANLIEIASSV